MTQVEEETVKQLKICLSKKANKLGRVLSLIDSQELKIKVMEEKW